MSVCLSVCMYALPPPSFIFVETRVEERTSSLQFPFKVLNLQMSSSWLLDINSAVYNHVVSLIEKRNNAAVPN